MTQVSNPNGNTNLPGNLLATSTYQLVKYLRDNEPLVVCGWQNRLLSCENDGGGGDWLTVSNVVVACECQTRTRHGSCGTSDKTSAGSQTSERDGK